MTIKVRAYREEEKDWIFKLNQSNTPEVGELDQKDFHDLLNLIHYCHVVEVDSKPAGFLMAMVPDIQYESDNYQWFSNRFDHFLYCDRIVIDKDFRGKGLGRALYEDMKGEAIKIESSICLCEINERPPNPKSLAFHQRLGFEKIETFQNPSSKKDVAMMKWDISR